MVVSGTGTKQHIQEPEQNFSVRDQNEQALMDFDFMELESRHSKLLSVLEKKEIAEVFFNLAGCTSQ